MADVVLRPVEDKKNTGLDYLVYTWVFIAAMPLAMPFFCQSKRRFSSKRPLFGILHYSM